MGNEWAWLFNSQRTETRKHGIIAHRLSYGKHGEIPCFRETLYLKVTPCFCGCQKQKKRSDKSMSAFIYLFPIYGFGYWKPNHCLTGLSGSRLCREKRRLFVLQNLSRIINCCGFFFHYFYQIIWLQVFLYPLGRNNYTTDKLFVKYFFEIAEKIQK